MSKPNAWDRILQQPQHCSHRLDEKGRLVFEQSFSGSRSKAGPSGYAAPPRKGDVLYPHVWTLGNPAREKYDGKPCRVVARENGSTARDYVITAVLA